MSACLFSLCDREPVMGSTHSMQSGQSVKSVRQSGCSLIRFPESCAAVLVVSDCDCDSAYVCFAFLCVNRGSFIELCLSAAGAGTLGPVSQLLLPVSSVLCSALPASQGRCCVCCAVLCWDGIHAAPSPPLGCFPSLPPPSVHPAKMASVPCPGLQAVRSQNWTPGCLPGVGPL